MPPTPRTAYWPLPQHPCIHLKFTHVNFSTVERLRSRVHGITTTWETNVIVVKVSRASTLYLLVLTRFWARSSQSCFFTFLPPKSPWGICPVPRERWQMWWHQGVSYISESTLRGILVFTGDQVVSCDSTSNNYPYTFGAGDDTFFS